MVLLSRQFQITPNYSVHTSAKTPCKKNHFNYYFTIIKSFRKPPYSVFKTTYFQANRFQPKKRKLQIHMISHCSKVLHLSPTLRPTLTLGERTKYLCAFPVRSHKVGSHSYRNGYHDSYQMSVRTTQQRSVFFPVFKECSGLRNLIYPHAILFQKFKKGKKVAVNNQEVRSRRKLHWK